MESKIYNTTITIEGVEQKNNKLTLVAHDKKRYGFWMTKKDGSDSAPYLQFKSMDLKQGDSVFIGYVLEPYTDSRGVNREALKIINFRETSEKPTQTASQPQTPRSGQNYASGEVSGRNWEKEAYEKCCSIWAAALYGGGFDSNKDPVNFIKEGYFWNTFQAIKADGEKRFNPSPLRQAVQAHAPKVVADELPTIQQDEAMDSLVESVPF
jgi:hypothetical protein